MTPLLISAPRLHRAAGQLTFSSRIRLPGGERELWFRGPEQVMAPQGADAFLIVCLTTAMRLGVPLVVEGEVSPRLLAATRTAQDIYGKWYGDLRQVPIQARARSPQTRSPAAGAAVFFSGGVDSFYTTYRHLSEITMLVLVHGFDIALDKQALRSRVSASLREAARSLGKPLVEVETNSRELTDPHVSWPDHQFGPALASVAVLLGGGVAKVFIAASESYAHLDPCGSHPLLDPLWSTEDVEIVHDGAEASRNEKVAAIARHPEALSRLRVCWENPADRYNCCRCEKCLRTMINLETVDALGKCTAFDAPLDLAAVANMVVPSDLVSFHTEENLRVLRQQNRNPALIAALECALNRYRAERAAKYLLSLPAIPGNRPRWEAAVRRLRNALFKAMSPGGSGGRLRRALKSCCRRSAP